MCSRVSIALHNLKKNVFSERNKIAMKIAASIIHNEAMTYILRMINLYLKNEINSIHRKSSLLF